MSDNHSEKSDDSKVVALTDAIMDQAPKSVAELERKRIIAIRAFQITYKQLEADALKMEETAILQDIPIQKRHEYFDLARALRMTTSWLLNLTGPEKGEARPQEEPQNAT